MSLHFVTGQYNSLGSHDSTFYKHKRFQHTQKFKILFKSHTSLYATVCCLHATCLAFYAVYSKCFKARLGNLYLCVKMWKIASTAYMIITGTLLRLWSICVLHIYQLQSICKLLRFLNVFGSIFFHSVTGILKRYSCQKGYQFKAWIHPT